MIFVEGPGQDELLEGWWDGDRAVVMGSHLNLAPLEQGVLPKC